MGGYPSITPEELSHAKVFGLEIARQIFQLHSVDPETGEVERLKLQREEVLQYFAKLSPAIVAMEACATSQHWARRFTALAHEVRLVATKFVRPFVKTNKTDAADAEAISCYVIRICTRNLR